MKLRTVSLALAAAGLLGSVVLAFAQHRHETDKRVLVRFPDQLRVQTMANMRDHLLALSQIQDALARGEYDEAGKIAEARLGMTSLVAHEAHEVAKYMPKGMQDAGTAMHHGASRFALELQKTAVTGDVKPALGALAETTRACVACHAGYRLQ
jgi:cytochrome c556